MPVCVRNYVKGEKGEHDQVPGPGPVFRRNGASLIMSSTISSIRLRPNWSSHVVDDDPSVAHALYPICFFNGLLFHYSIVTEQLICSLFGFYICMV